MIIVGARVFKQFIVSELRRSSRTFFRSIRLLGNSVQPPPQVTWTKVTQNTLKIILGAARRPKTALFSFENLESGSLGGGSALNYPKFRIYSALLRKSIPRCLIFIYQHLWPFLITTWKRLIDPKATFSALR